MLHGGRSMGRTEESVIVMVVPRMMGRGGEEHHCRPRVRVLLLLAVGTDDDDGVGMYDGGDR